jgi:hypothetical protein
LSVFMVAVFLSKVYIGNHPDSSLGRALAFYFA